MATFPELLANLDPKAQRRGRQFEKICKWYLRHDPIYKAQLEEVWLWDEWPDRDGPDLGIDLVARTKDGRLWAIQAKAYDPDKTLRKSDVDSFLANSARPDFAFRLILTTCKDLTNNLRGQFAKVTPPVSARVLSDLEAANVNWPESTGQLRAPKPPPKKPRPHQREAVSTVVKGFKNRDRGRLVMACGTGKTLVGLWVAEKLKAERTLVLLPSLSLLGQTMEEWLANGTRTPSVLAVCSDESVRKGADEWVSDTSELGIPVTTDPAEIAAFLDGPGPLLVFSTYHSSPQIAEAQTITDASFDLAVADEAHRCAGRVSSDFATVLDSEAIRTNRRLFMTATPRYFTGRVKKIANEQEWEIASMDDEAKFGPQFHKLTVGEAIERDLLSPYQVLIVGVDDPTYKMYAVHGRFVTRDGKQITDARTLATHIALAKAMKKYDLRRVITFHSRISRAKKFAEDFPEVVEWMPKDDGPDGDIWCDHVSGKMRTNQRKARLDRLREVDGGGRGLLANARCLGEGVDVPTLDGVAFVDPRRSQVDIVQNVGRAIRKADDKTVGIIVLPVFIDSSEDPETAVEGSDFGPVWDVLRALRDHDDELAQTIDSIRQARAWLTGIREPDWPPYIVLDLPAQVSRRFAKAIETKLVDRVGRRPQLTEDQILLWADTHLQHTGEWPRKESGSVIGAAGENWANISQLLRMGLRGLKGESSLAALLEERRGVRPYRGGPDLTEEKILEWADTHLADTGSWPTTLSAGVKDIPEEDWKTTIDKALRVGRRGLHGGSSLADLLLRERGVRHHRAVPDLSYEAILEWADDHRTRTGRWPNQSAGPIHADTEENWQAVNTALQQGLRGLPKGLTLGQLLVERRGAVIRTSREPLTVASILRWADAHCSRTGAWPKAMSGPIKDASGETWAGVNWALSNGARGLRGGSSLARLLAAHRGRKNIHDLPAVNEETILGWADAHRRRTGEWPSAHTGVIPETPGTKWSNIDVSLSKGFRGLPGGSSLAKLLDEHRRKN